MSQKYSFATFTNPVETYKGDHVIVIGDYDHVLHDYLKRDFAIQFKCNSVKALGYPHYWNEQKRIPSNTQAIDPKMGLGTSTPSYRPAVADVNYDRDNWNHAFCRTYVTGIRYEYFDREMAKNYGSFEDLIAKDTNDMMVDFTKTTVNDFWNGKSDMKKNDSANLKYSGIISQITDIGQIAFGDNIADSITTKITNMMARLDYTYYPNVLAMNPATYDLILKQEGARDVYSRPVDIDIIPGISVPSFYTPVGKLPIVLDPFIKPAVAESGPNSGKMVHQIIALNTDMIDRIWMFNDGPQIFNVENPEQPFNNDRLLTDMFILDFANYILQAPHTGAHFIMEYAVPV